MFERDLFRLLPRRLRRFRRFVAAGAWIPYVLAIIAVALLLALVIGFLGTAHG
jgi:hypothetical protein